MPFSTFEQSRDQGAPVTLFLFLYGTTPDAYYGYTDAEQEIVTGGRTFTPIPVQRSNIASNGTLDKAQLTVRGPHDSPLSELFKVYPPAQVVTLIIYQGHAEDPDAEFMAVWSGRVLSCTREDGEAVYACEPVNTSLRRPGLRRNYQYGCPHVLYGPQCLANQAAASIEVAAQSVAGYAVTLTPGWSTGIDATKFLMGVVSWEGATGTEIRTVIRIDGDVLDLSGPTFGLVSGAALTLSRGCNHQMNDCLDVHNNIHNYGGQPWIPLKNPIGIVNNFY